MRPTRRVPTLPVRFGHSRYCCEVEDYFAIDASDRGTRGTRSILYCGQLMERKGIDVLLEAFARVADKLPDATLSLVGTGP